MWYLKQDGSFAKTTNAELIKLENLFQELKLWKGENPMNVELGIDYLGVFENRVSLKSSVQSICDKYSDSFKNIEVGDLNIGSEVATIPITLTLQDDSTIVRELKVLI